MFIEGLLEFKQAFFRSEAMKFKGKKFSFSVVRKRLPTGLIVEVDRIEHPGAVLIVPFLDKDKVVFLEQYRPVLGRYLLELPAGTLNKNERPLLCAQRELTEETNYKAGRLRRLGRIYPVPGYSTEIIHIYKAEGLISSPGAKDIDEIIHPRILTRIEAKRLLREGRIHDAKTICGLAMCGWL